ncbi:MAG: restriction endonuclease subunit S [Bacteroidales bacterium]|nr:restriction endonuclease subunit S [Bacteroidales bacterium]
MRAMKDSGIPWIGEIPKDWNCSKTKFFTRISSGDGISNEELQDGGEYEVLGGGSGIMGYHNNYNIDGDNLIIGRVGACGYVKRTNGKRYVSDNALIMRITSNTLLFNYLYYVLTSAELSRLNTSTAQPLITATKVYNVSIPIPSYAEQQRIAEFLDRKCAEVDEMIALQEQIIEELKAYKQSVITEAVTKGLNPDVPMKDSGSLWIGEIPTNWNLTRIGDVGEYKKGPFGSAITLDMFVPKGEHTIKVYEQQNAIKKDWTLGYYYLPVDYFESCLKGFEVLPNDIIVSCAGTIGEVYQLPMEVERGIINQALMRMRINSTINLSYFLYIFDLILKREAERSSNGTAIKNIPPFSIFKKILVPLPSLEEQQKIADYLDEKCADIDSLIQTKQSKIDSLKEYKKSIIYEYVTGKREVE